jgi:hypothetical protein
MGSRFPTYMRQRYIYTASPPLPQPIISRIFPLIVVKRTTSFSPQHTCCTTCQTIEGTIDVAAIRQTAVVARSRCRPLYGLLDNLPRMIVQVGQRQCTDTNQALKAGMNARYRVPRLALPVCSPTHLLPVERHPLRKIIECPAAGHLPVRSLLRRVVKCQAVDQPAPPNQAQLSGAVQRHLTPMHGRHSAIEIPRSRQIPF